MVKALVDICHVCLAQNLGKINRVGKFLSRSDKEILLEWLCDHDMFSKERLHFITYQLFSPLLTNVTFSYSDQVKDPLLASLAACASKLRSITIKSCCNVTDKGVNALLKQQEQLEYLELKDGHSHLTDKSLASLKCSTLSVVYLKGLDQLTDAGVICLVKNCPKIREVNLVRCVKLTDVAVQGIAAGLGKTLELLNLTGAQLVTDLSLCTLGNGASPNLKQLHLNGCCMITGKGIREVSKGCPALSHLDLGYCYRIVNDGESPSSETMFPTSLTELTLLGVQLSAEFLKSFVTMVTQIKVLRLCGIQSVDDDVLESICSFVGRSLTELDLSACTAITDDGLATVARHCHQIEALQLSFCRRVTGEKLRPLFADPARAAGIKSIVVNGCKLFSVDVIHAAVSSCLNLEMLKVAAVKDVDDGLLIRVADHCKQLKVLNVKGCNQVTDSGLCEVLRVSPLEILVVSGVHNLTDKSVFALANSCSSTLVELYASGCNKMTVAATNYLKDCCMRRILVEHKTPNLDPDQLMAKNLDTGEFCRADLLPMSKLGPSPGGPFAEDRDMGPGD